MDNYDVAIIGVRIVAKLLNFPEPELYIVEQDKLPNKEITRFTT